jgi:predicted dehydrogenase
VKNSDPASNRRRFLKTSTATAALVTVPHLAHAAKANETIVMGIIGPGGMGMNHVRGFADADNVEVAYVCDVDEKRLASAAEEVARRGRAPKAVKDMRTIFEDKNVDAVAIATPDHWHTPASILACEAGKHVYIEKPVSHNVREGRLLVEAAERNKVVVQHGTQSRSTAPIIEAMERLHSGVIGEVLVAKAWNSQRRSSIGKSKPIDPPAHLDFDLWLGPAPKVPYRPNMLHSIWRWWYDYGCGDIGNDGVHDLDIARWGLGTFGERHPNRIMAMGGKYFFDDDMQWPDTQTVLYEYAPAREGERPRQLIFEQRIWSPYVQEGFENGNAFYGTKGMMLLGKRGGYKLYGERNKLIEDKPAGGPDLGAHHRNFLAAVRGEEAAHANALTAHLSSSLCHLGNIAIRTGRRLNFDPVKELVDGDEEANGLVGREYRKHWGVPAGA